MSPYTEQKFSLLGYTGTTASSFHEQMKMKPNHETFCQQYSFKLGMSHI